MTSESMEFVQVIVQAIQKRDFVHRKVTNSVAKKIDFVFEAIVEYLNENALVIEWGSIDTTGNLLIVTATIPSTNSPNQRSISVGIPFDVIQKQSKDAVLEFFAQAEAARNKHIEEEMEDDIDVDSFDDLDDDNNTIVTSPTIKRVLH